MDAIELQAEIARMRKEIERLKDVIRHVENCLPDMPRVALQTIELAGVRAESPEGGI